MRLTVANRQLITFMALVAAPAGAQRARSVQGVIPLDLNTSFSLVNTRLQSLEYRGRPALKLTPLVGHERDVNQEMAAILTNSDFKDGTIEVDVAGARREGYSTTEDVSGFKGIIGVSFHQRGDTADRFYIRPENSPLNNQLFRNRTTQYEASPGYPWEKLREESPGVYESYAPIEPGAWTRLRIEVSGTTARLYINDAAAPYLVVNDLRYSNRAGQIALWTRVSTEAYFSNLRITPVSSGKTITPDSLRFTELVNGTSSVVNHLGRLAVHLTPSAEASSKDTDMLAIIAGSEFRDGTIELAVAGAPRPGAPADSRGFIGLAFHVADHGAQSEIVYLRPTNGRAEDQLRRNHTVQYESSPEYPWHRLRSESPGLYESYVDIEAGAWTKMKIVIAGTTARLYVNDAAQPVLVVNDLKRGVSGGLVALWAHVETDAYFGAVTIRPASP